MKIIFTIALLMFLAGCATVSPEAYNPPEVHYVGWHPQEWYEGVPWRGYYRCSPYPNCPGSHYSWATPKKKEMPHDKYQMRRGPHDWGLFHEEMGR